MANDRTYSLIFCYPFFIILLISYIIVKNKMYFLPPLPPPLFPPTSPKHIDIKYMMSLFRLIACFKYVMMTAILTHASCPVLARYGTKCSAIFLERTREGHRQSDKHWNCLKGVVGETSERHGRAHMGFSGLFFAMSVTLIFFF